MILENNRWGTRFYKYRTQNRYSDLKLNHTFNNSKKSSHLKMDSNMIESFEDFDYHPAISENINLPGGEFLIVIYNEDIITQSQKK